MLLKRASVQGNHAPYVKTPPILATVTTMTILKTITIMITMIILPILTITGTALPILPISLPLELRTSGDGRLNLKPLLIGLGIQEQ